MSASPGICETEAFFISMYVSPAFLALFLSNEAPMALEPIPASQAKMILLTPA